EMENQDLVAAPALHDLAADQNVGSRADLAFFPGNGQDILELNRIAIIGRQFLDFYNVSGSNTILFPPGANDRVHILSVVLSNCCKQRTVSVDFKILLKFCGLRTALLNRQDLTLPANLVILT